MNFKSIKETVGKASEERMCDRVLSRIDNEEISPSPRWHFMCIHYGVWILWALSVVSGAIAVSVMVYVATRARFALFEATHETQLSFFVEVLPYLWIFILFLMGVFAYYNMRHTKQGYKYPITHIVLSSLAFSIVGGIVLNIFGVGYLIDTSLSRGMPVYPSLEKVEERMWQNPNEGRLIGRWQGTEDDMMLYHFIDKNDVVWSVTVHELRDKDLQLLESGQAVRLLGTTTDLEKRNFYACGVFPWMFNSAVGTDDMAKNREEFVKRMYSHMETGDRLKAFEAEVYKDRPLQGKPFMEGLCSEITAVKRVKFIN